MFKITLIDNLDRTTTITSPDTTVAQFVAKNNVVVGNRTLSINGATLTDADQNKTFAQLFREYDISGDKASIAVLARKNNA